MTSYYERHMDATFDSMDNAYPEPYKPYSSHADSDVTSCMDLSDVFALDEPEIDDEPCNYCWRCGSAMPLDDSERVCFDCDPTRYL